MNCSRQSGQVQTILLGVIFFCIPGMFNAVASMAGGLDDPGVASPATAALYTCFATFSLLAPVATNVCGIRATMLVGACGYTLYVAALLAFRMRLVGARVVIASAAANGVGAALLTTAGGTLLFALPAEETRGRHLSLWRCCSASGPSREACSRLRSTMSPRPRPPRPEPTWPSSA